MAEQPNVVVVVMDTTRIDDAYDAQVAPTLANLADSGMRATRAFSATPWTLPSHASFLTGTHSSKHGAMPGTNGSTIDFRCFLSVSKTQATRRLRLEQHLVERQIQLQPRI